MIPRKLKQVKVIKKGLLVILCKKVIIMRYKILAALIFFVAHRIQKKTHKQTGLMKRLSKWFTIEVTTNSRIGIQTDYCRNFVIKWIFT